MNENLSYDERLEIMVTDILKGMGVPAHVKGYHYLRYAIIDVVKDDDVTLSITKTVYPNVSKKFNTTPPRAERAMRHAIEIAFVRGSSQIFDEYFGYALCNSGRKPTNSEFIAVIADSIRMKLKIESKKE